MGKFWNIPETLDIPDMENLRFKNHLTHFTGSEQYYEYKFLNLTMLLTEGANFVREEGKAYWLIDMICSFQPALRKKEFQTWTLKYQGEGKGWKMTATDGNKRILAEQEFAFSDFPLKEFVLWVEGNVILLPSEH